MSEKNTEPNAKNGIEMPPMPEYELSSYEPVEFEMPKLAVSDQQVEQKMMEYADKFGAEYEPTVRTIVGEKENIKMDIDVLKDGEPVRNLCSKDRLYTLDEGLMPPGFDEYLKGMKVGETKTFTFLAPDFSDAEGAQRDFEATVTINTIMKKKAVVIDDEWVSQHMPVYRNAEEFRTVTRKGIMDEAQQVYEQEKNARAAHALSERFDGAIDDAFYNATRADMLNAYEQQASMQGMELDEFIKAQGMDENSFSMMLMMQVRETLVQGFVLDAWARHYDIKVTAEDEKALAEMMAPGGHAQELLANFDRSPQEKEAFRLAARRYVANCDVAKKAHITYVQED